MVCLQSVWSNILILIEAAKLHIVACWTKKKKYRILWECYIFFVLQEDLSWDHLIYYIVYIGYQNHSYTDWLYDIWYTYLLDALTSFICVGPMTAVSRNASHDLNHANTVRTITASYNCLERMMGVIYARMWWLLIIVVWWV